MMIRFKYWVLLILLISVSCFSQGVINKYPVFFDQYFSCLSLVNPSVSGLEYNYEFSAGHQRLLGNFSKLSTNYFIFNKRFKTYNITAYPFSSFGIFLYNDREGQYLNRGRFYLQYAWHSRIFEKYFISGGLKVGGVNYLVKGTPLSGNGSSYNADGGAGVSFYNKSFYLGICFDQMFNSELQPIDEITILSPFVLINTYKVFNINKSYSLTPYFLTRLTTDRMEKHDIYSLNIKFEIIDKIYFTGGVRSGSGMIFMLGTKNLNLADGVIDFGISYLIPTTRSVLNINTLEFNLGYKLKKL